MTKPKIALIAAALAVASSAIGPAYALPRASNSGMTKDALVKDGYTCVRVSVNFIECTKKGSKTYWCDDAGKCEQAPARQTRPKDPNRGPAPTERSR